MQCLHGLGGRSDGFFDFARLVLVVFVGAAAGGEPVPSASAIGVASAAPMTTMV